MRYCSRLLLLAVACGCVAADEEEAKLEYLPEEPWCLLTQAEAPDVKKPFPSLLQCYKHNDKSCCVAAHDAAIRDGFGELMSESCLAQFPELADFYCAGCNPKQPLFTSTTNDQGLTMRVCKSFADAIWNPTSGDASDPTKYDHCGVNTGKDDDPQIPGRHVGEAAWNQTAFLNMVRPPFFEDYHIEIVPDGDDCMSPAGRVVASAVLAVALFVLSVVVLV